MNHIADRSEDHTPIDLEKEPLGSRSGHAIGHPFHYPSCVTRVEWKDEAVHLTVRRPSPDEQEWELRLTAEEAYEVVANELDSRANLPAWVLNEADYRFYRHLHSAAGWPLGDPSRKGAVVLHDITDRPWGRVALHIGQVAEVEERRVTEVARVLLNRHEAVDLAVRLLRPEKPTHLVTVVRGSFEGHLNGDTGPRPHGKVFHEGRAFERAERVGYTGEDEMFLLFTPVGEDSGASSFDIVGTFEIELR